MGNIIVTSLLSQINTQDINFATLNIDDLIIGKDDKRIGVISESGIETILNYPSFTKINSTNGYIKLPVNVGGITFVDIIIQWGRVDLVQQTDTTFDYNIPFNDSCFILQATANYSGDIATVKIDKVSNSQFKMKSTDGTNTSRVFWFAIGM